MNRLADGELNNNEIQFLSPWLYENQALYFFETRPEPH